MLTFNKCIILLFAILAPSLALAQRSEWAKNFQPSEDIGLYANNIVDLVMGSSIVVKGRFGKILNHKKFFGYDTTQDGIPDISWEQYQVKTGLPVSEKEFAGIDITDYEIIIDEVVKSDVRLGDSIVLRLSEGPDYNSLPSELIVDKEGEHLLFLIRNPGGRTYGIPGSMFNMKLENDAYTFRYLDTRMTTLGSHNAERFLNEIHEVVDSSEIYR